MAVDQSNGNGSPGARSRLLRPLVGIGGRAATSTLRPLSGAVEAAAHAGIGLERLAVKRLLDSGELDRILTTALGNPRLQAAVHHALGSAGARHAVDSFFDSGLFDHFIERLMASDALWRLVDEIAQSPSVTAAISQQGLGFADQVGDQMRARSRTADDWLERTAQRLVRRRRPPPGSNPEPRSS